MNDHQLTAADGYAESPLHAAAWVGDLEEVKRLIEAGVDVNWQDSIGETALFGACAWGREAVVTYLVAHGARHDLREISGFTPLHWAARSNLETVKVLIAAGADPTVKDNIGRLPVDVAHQYGKGQHVAYLKKVGPGLNKAFAKTHPKKLQRSPDFRGR